MDTKRRLAKARIFATRLLAVLFFAFVAISSSRWEGSLVSGALFSAGALLVGVASVGRLWCNLYLAGHRNKDLVTVGPYSMCRNPLYFFSLIGAAGVGFATETLIVPAIILAAFAIYYPMVIRSEQQVLRSAHGEAFEAYVRSTPAFIPRPWLLREPEEWAVDPVRFRKKVLDAIWFIWLLGALEAVEALHEAGVIPVFLRLW